MGSVWSSMQSGIDAVCTARSDLPVLTDPHIDPLILAAQRLSIVKSPNQPYLKLHVILLSLLLFTLAFITVNIISCLTRIFQQLNPSTEVFWCQTFVSLIFSIFTTPFTLWLILVDDNLKTDLVNNTSLISTLLIGIGIGYNVYEITTQVAAYVLFQYRNPYLLIHHMSGLLSGTLMVYYNQGHFFGCAALLIEASIAFRSLSIILKEIQLEGTWLWRFMKYISIYLDIYCPLLGVYCIALSYLQWESISEDLSLPILAVVFPSLITELFVISSHWSHESMQELFGATVAMEDVAMTTAAITSSSSQTDTSRETMEGDKN